MKSLSKNPSCLMISEKTSTLRDALVIIQNNIEKIALIIDEKNLLVALVTDGDVRRALLAGNSLESLAISSVKKSFIFREKNTEGDSFNVSKAIREENIKQLPILDSQGLLVKLYFLIT